MTYFNNKEKRSAAAGRFFGFWGFNPVMQICTDTRPCNGYRYICMGPHLSSRLRLFAIFPVRAFPHPKNKDPPVARIAAEVATPRGIPSPRSPTKESGGVRGALHRRRTSLHILTHLPVTHVSRETFTYPLPLLFHVKHSPTILLIFYKISRRPLIFPPVCVTISITMGQCVNRPLPPKYFYFRI